MQHSQNGLQLKAQNKNKTED